MTLALTDKATASEDFQTDATATLIDVAAAADGGVENRLKAAFRARQGGRLDEARAILEAAAEEFPLEAEVLHDLARLEEAERNWSEAELYWRGFLVLRPAIWWAHARTAAALREQGKINQAEALLSDALECFPQEAGLFIDHARLAEARGDWPEAGARWAAVTASFPLAWEGPAGQARALKEQSEPAEAKALLEEAVARFPAEAGLLPDLAQLEEAARNWPTAERHWRTFLALSPSVWWGHTRAAAALREQGRLAEAEALLADARGLFPQERGVLLEYARMAELRRDWPEAISRWAAVAEHFPERWEGLAGEARALREQGRLEEARALLLRAVARFPAEAGLLPDLARLDEAGRHWPEAERHWRAFAELKPAVWWGYAEIARALREQGRMADAEALLADAQQRLPDEPGVFIEHARLAEHSRDWAEAAARWTAVTGRFPRRWEGLAGQARALREQGQPAEARALLVAAVERFPTVTGPLHDLARLEEAERNWPRAERCWWDFVTLDPAPWWAHAGLANALAEQGRTTEAESVLTEQFGRLADEPAVFIAYARLADRLRNWVEAERRWSAVAAQFPRLWDGFGGQARSLREQGRLDEAQALLDGVAARFPGLIGPLEEGACIAEARGDWAVAEDAWRGLMAINQGIWWVVSRVLRAQCRQGKIEQAFTTFAVARGKFPGNNYLTIDFARALLEEDCQEQAKELVAQALAEIDQLSPREMLDLAWLALRCGNLDRAAEVAEKLRAGPPEDPHAATQFEHALAMRIEALAAEEQAVAQAVVEDHEGGSPASDDVEIAYAPEVVTRFESLGGDHPGYEIGLVQRKFGAEPVGLLRWTTVLPGQLIDAMRSRFEGVGSPAQTELVTTSNGFYRTMDRRFEMDMLTVCEEQDVAISRRHLAACAQISLLREKLIKELAQSDKIFVYRTINDCMSVADVKALKQAMSQYGRNNLLYLQQADEANPVGSIRLESADLCFGYVEKFSTDPVSLLHLNGWYSVFEKAAATWSVAQPDEAAPVGAQQEQPAKAAPWLRRAAGMFRSRGGVGRAK